MKSINITYGDSMLGNNDIRITTSVTGTMKGNILEEKKIDSMVKYFRGDMDRVFLELAKDLLIETIVEYDNEKAKAINQITHFTNL